MTSQIKCGQCQASTYLKEYKELESKYTMLTVTHAHCTQCGVVYVVGRRREPISATTVDPRAVESRKRRAPEIETPNKILDRRLLLCVRSV